jgi:hypothetical protein
MSEVDIKEVVRGRYAEIARSVRAPGSSCCYDGEAGSCGISANLYADDETGVPARKGGAGLARLRQSERGRDGHTFVVTRSRILLARTTHTLVSHQFLGNLR